MENNPARLADALGCEDVESLDDLIFPLRSAAARAGVRCSLGDATLHIFERDPNGGSVAEIDRSLGADLRDPACRTWVIISEEWFVVADDDEVLSEIEDELSGAIRPIQPVSPTIPATRPASVVHDAYEEPEWDLCVRVLADHLVETRTGEVVSFRYRDNPNVPSKNAHRGPELLAYMALRGDRSATLDQIRDDMWWQRKVGRRTADTLVTATRKVIGGPRHLGYAQGDPTRRRYELAATVVTDVELLDQALAYARAVATSDTTAAVAALRPHLARIKAPPFRPDHLGGGLADWASGNRITDRIEATIAEAGLLAADLLAAQGPDGAAEALWALDQALLVKPESEPLTRRAMQLEASLGNRDAAEQRYRALTTLLARHELEPAEDTTRLHREITSPTRIG